jgi:hypothetical protein
MVCGRRPRPEAVERGAVRSGPRRRVGRVWRRRWMRRPGGRIDDGLRGPVLVVRPSVPAATVGDGRADVAWVARGGAVLA